MDSYLIWFFVGLGFLILEGLIPAFFSIFFTIGSWVVAILLFFNFDLTFNQQLLILLGTSSISLLIFRKKFISYSDSEKAFDDQDRPMSGKGNIIAKEFKDNPQYAIVTKNIIPSNFGEIKFRGTFYKAKSSEKINKDENVRVINTGDKNGSYFVVEKDN